MRHRGYLSSNPFSTGEALSKHVRTYFNNIPVHFISLLSSQRAFGKQSGLMQLSSANAGSGRLSRHLAGLARWGTWRGGGGVGAPCGGGGGGQGFQFLDWREGGGVTGGRTHHHNWPACPSRAGHGLFLPLVPHCTGSGATTVAAACGNWLMSHPVTALLSGVCLSRSQLEGGWPLLRSAECSLCLGC